MCNRTFGGDDYLGGTGPVGKDENFCTRKHPHIPSNPSFRADPKADQRMKLKRPPSISSSINFPLKKKSIHKTLWKIWHVFSYKKNKKNKNTIFKGSSSSAPGRCVLWRCCFRYISTWKPWKRRVIWVDRRMLFVFVGVLCRGSWNH